MANRYRVTQLLYPLFSSNLGQIFCDAATVNGPADGKEADNTGLERRRLYNLLFG
jgi:hypothetical protein